MCLVLLLGTLYLAKEIWHFFGYGGNLRIEKFGFSARSLGTFSLHHHFTFFSNGFSLVFALAKLFFVCFSALASLAKVIGFSLATTLGEKNIKPNTYCLKKAQM